MFNYFDKTDEALRQGAKNTYAHAKGNFTRLGIPDPEPTLKAPVDNYDAALTKAKNTDRTKSDVLLKKQTKTTLMDTLRPYGEEYIFHNHNLTAADIIAFDLHQNKPRTPIKPPDTVPVIVVITSFVRQLRFKYFKMPGDKKMGKPDGASKFVVYYLVSNNLSTRQRRADYRLQGRRARPASMVRCLLGNRAQRPGRPQERNANGARTVRSTSSKKKMPMGAGLKAPL
jgi:hypothetical protein